MFQKKLILKVGDILCCKTPILNITNNDGTVEKCKQGQLFAVVSYSEEKKLYTILSQKSGICSIWPNVIEFSSIFMPL